MLKSKLIDTKYVDPKGVTRTPNVITSITEDEIKEGKFSPEDILPAMAVQVALSNAGSEFPIPYTEDDQILTFQLGQSDYNCVNVKLDGKYLLIGADNTEEYKCIYAFGDDGATIKSLGKDDKNFEYIVIKPDFINMSTIVGGSIYRQTSVNYGSIYVSTDRTATMCKITPDNIRMKSATDTVTIYMNHLKTLRNIVSNSSNSISDVDTSATLSDLISSYNSLLAHLRTSGILKS